MRGQTPGRRGDTGRLRQGKTCHVILIQTPSTLCTGVVELFLFKAHFYLNIVNYAVIHIKLYNIYKQLTNLTIMYITVYLYELTRVLQ